MEAASHYKRIAKIYPISVRNVNDSLRRYSGEVNVSKYNQGLD